jgi:putative DNA primase/helicase
MNQFFLVLFGRAPGFIEHRFKPEGGGMQSRSYPTVATFLESMSYWNARAHHYFGVATRKDRTGGRKENLSSLLCFHADIDYGPERFYKTLEEALAAIEAFPICPSSVVHTGNGFHAYWFLHSPLPATDNLFQVEAINKGIGQALKGDPVGDASRILRVPGTWNVKNPDHPKPVRLLLWCEDRRYSLEDFAQYAALTPEKTKPAMAPMPVNYGDVGGTPYGRVALAKELARLARAREGSHFRNIQLNRSAYALGRLVGAGQLDQDITESHLYQIGLNIGLSEREVAATLRSGLEAGIRDPRHI